jgi:hypothetical protein
MHDAIVELNAMEWSIGLVTVEMHSHKKPCGVEPNKAYLVGVPFEDANTLYHT